MIDIKSTNMNNAVEEIKSYLAQKAKPCPLCGNGNLQITVKIDGCPPWTQIRCLPCNLFMGAMSHVEVLDRWNKRDSMSIEKVQEMALDLADRCCVGLYNEKSIKEFIEEWRRNNDC